MVYHLLPNKAVDRTYFEFNIKSLKLIEAPQEKPQFSILPYRSVGNNCWRCQRDNTICIHHVAIDRILAPIAHPHRYLEYRNCCCSSQRIVVHGNPLYHVDNHECYTIDIWCVCQYSICRHWTVPVNRIHGSMIERHRHTYDYIDQIYKIGKLFVKVHHDFGRKVLFVIKRIFTVSMSPNHHRFWPKPFDSVAHIYHAGTNIHYHIRCHQPMAYAVFDSHPLRCHTIIEHMVAIVDDNRIKRWIRRDFGTIQMENR